LFGYYKGVEMKTYNLVVTACLFFALAFSAQAKVALTKNNTSNSAASNVVDLKIDSNQEVYGIQFDISFESNEVDLDIEALKASISDKFMFEAKKISDGVVKGLVFSMNGERVDETISFSFNPVNGFNGQAEISFDEIILANQQGELIPSSASSGKVDFSNALPLKTDLYNAYPNPFNPTTNIKYDIASAGLVEINIYDTMGRLVTSLVNDYKEPGSYNIKWNASNQASGMYFVQFSAENSVLTQKLMLLK